MWYAMQVQAGSEKKTCKLVERVVSNSCYKQVRVLYRQSKRHKNGEWVTVDELLFPGYLFVNTRTPLKFCEELRGVPAFTYLLGGNEETDRFSPLSSEEEKVLNALINVDGCIVASTAVSVGDQIQLLSGPLVGHEALIKKIDRHKRAAYVEISICGRRSLVKVGLDFVERPAS